MKYVEGLYKFWDDLRALNPDCFMDGCAGGGRRMDIEAIRRFNVHQTTDYWFNDMNNQSSMFSLSQYLPNCCLTTHINRLDDYSFTSVIPASLCLGWIADDADFDYDTAKKLIDTYHSIKHIFNKDWYPLTPYSRQVDSFIGSQYHDELHDEGIILIFRREECVEDTLEVSLRKIKTGDKYEVVDLFSDVICIIKGSELVNNWKVNVKERPGAALLKYKRHSVRC